MKLINIIIIISLATIALTQHPREILFTKANNRATIIMPPTGINPIDPRTMTGPPGIFLSNVCCDFYVNDSGVMLLKSLNMDEVYCSSGIRAYRGETNPTEWLFGENTPHQMVFPYNGGYHWHPYFVASVKGTYLFQFQLREVVDKDDNPVQNSMVYSMTFIGGPINTINIDQTETYAWQKVYTVKAISGNAVFGFGEGAVSSLNALKFNFNLSGLYDVAVKLSGAISKRFPNVSLNASTASEKFICDWTPTFGDADNDDAVDDKDILTIASRLGQFDLDPNEPADFNGDLTISALDLYRAIANLTKKGDYAGL